MTNFEIASIVVSSAALALSIVAFVRTIFIQKENKNHRVFEKLDKYLVNLLDSKLPQICNQFVVPDHIPTIINVKNISKVEDLIKEIRSKFLQYKENIDEKTFKESVNVLNNFEDACLDLVNNQSDKNVNLYNKEYSNTKTFVSLFIKKH